MRIPDEAFTSEMGFWEAGRLLRRLATSADPEGPDSLRAPAHQRRGQRSESPRADGVRMTPAVEVFHVALHKEIGMKPAHECRVPFASILVGCTLGLALLLGEGLAVQAQYLYTEIAPPPGLA
jgi:hypothetical protein